MDLTITLKCLDADLSQVVGSSLHLDLFQQLRSTLQILRQHQSSDEHAAVSLTRILELFLNGHVTCAGASLLVSGS